MLSKEKQKKFLRKNDHLIISCLMAFCENKNAEDLHKMRVGIKKLQAFIYFLKKKSPLKHFPIELDPIKGIFKHAGLIRNAQVNLELAERFHLKNKNFREEQSKIIEIESTEFCLRNVAASRNIKRFAGDLLPYLKDVKNNSILNFFKKEINKLGQKLNADISTDEWHSFRKKIKIILYVYQWANKSAIKKIHLNISYLDDLQESIGKWHDTVMAAGFINQKSKSAKVLAEKFIHESDLQKEELMGKVQDFIGKSTRK